VLGANYWADNRAHNFATMYTARLKRNKKGSIPPPWTLGYGTGGRSHI
jgi:hypothetical protein